MSFARLFTLILAIAGFSFPANAQSNLTAETASPIETPGYTVLGLADLASAANIANIQVATGQTLTNTVQNIAEGKTDIGSGPFALTFLMSNGAGPYAKLGKEKGAELAKNIAVLYTYRYGTTTLSAFESKNFGGWDSIAGSTIYNGPPRGAALIRSRAVVKLVTGMDEGEGYNAIQVNWGQAVKTMSDGSADANLLPAYFPDGRLTQTAAKGKMIVYSMPKDKFESEAAQKYMKSPGLVGVSVAKKNLFGPDIKVVSEDDLFRGIASVGGEVVNVSMSEDLAYGLTKAFLEGIESLKARAPSLASAGLGETDIENTGLCGMIPIKYHPGAVRAWEEAGYTLPDCAKP